MKILYSAHDSRAASDAVTRDFLCMVDKEQVNWGVKKTR